MIAVLIDHAGGAPSGASLEVLTLARSLGDPVAVWVGDAPGPSALSLLAEYGAREVRAVEPGASRHLPVVAASAVEAALSAAPAVDWSLLLGVSFFPVKEVLARVAVTSGAGMVVDVSSVEVVDGHVETTQAVFTATWTVRTRIATERAIVLLRPNSAHARPSPEPGGATLITVAESPVEPQERLVSREAVEPDGVPLAEAAVVVAGGRGTGGDFALVRELAELLGGAVGATRDATDEGWISHEHMVGQTGTTVTPALYIGCGISGAVHHRGGMQGSRTIVAINADDSAPIFDIADFGVVGTSSTFFRRRSPRSARGARGASCSEPRGPRGLAEFSRPEQPSRNTAQGAQGQRRMPP